MSSLFPHCRKVAEDNQVEKQRQSLKISEKNNFCYLAGFNNKARLLARTQKITLKHFNKLLSAFPFKNMFCDLDIPNRRQRYINLCSFCNLVSDRNSLRTVLPLDFDEHSRFQRGSFFHGCFHSKCTVLREPHMLVV